MGFAKEAAKLVAGVVGVAQSLVSHESYDTRNVNSYGDHEQTRIEESYQEATRAANIQASNAGQAQQGQK